MNRTHAILAATLLAATSATAQVVFNTVGGTYSQNFNWTSTGTTTEQTVNWTSNAATQPFTTVNFTGNTTGWYAGSNSQDSTSIRVGNGNQTDNASILIYNYYFTSSDADRSFGGRPTGSVPVVLALRLNNSTGVTLTNFTLSYALEVTQWRANGNQATANVAYFIGNPTNWRTDAFTATPTLNLTTVYGGDTAVAVNNVDGNHIGNRASLAPTTITGLNWTNGSDLWIRWTLPVGTNLPNVGLDDVSFSAVPEPSTYAALAGIAALGLALYARRRR
jgi:hypothetical protein